MNGRAFFCFTPATTYPIKGNQLLELTVVLQSINFSAEGLTFLTAVVRPHSAVLLFNFVQWEQSLF